MIPLSKDVGRLLVTSFYQKKNVLFVKHSCIHHTCFDGFENTQVPTTLIEWSHRKDTDIFRKLRHSGYLKRTTLGQNVFVKTHHVAPWTQKWLEILSNVSSASETMTFLFFLKSSSVSACWWCSSSWPSSSPQPSTPRPTTTAAAAEADRTPIRSSWRRS